MDEALRLQPAHRRQADLDWRRPVCSRRHHRPDLRRVRLRAPTRRVAPVPAEPADERPGPLLPGRRTPRAGRRRSSRRRRDSSCRPPTTSGSSPMRCRRDITFSAQPLRRRARRQRPAHAVAAAGRRQPGAAHRVRERGEPAARARHEPQAGDCGARGHRRRGVAASSASSSPRACMLSLAGGALGLVLGIVGIRALLAVNTAGLPRVGENGSVVTRRLAGARLHARAVDCDGHRVRPDSRAACVAHGPQHDAQGRQQPGRHGLPPEQDALGAGRG